MNLLERERIVDLLQNDHRVGSNRSNGAVRQLVARAHDVGLAVDSLDDADEVALGQDDSTQADFSGSQSGQACDSLCLR
jgi:hypothetical protein